MGAAPDRRAAAIDVLTDVNSDQQQGGLEADVDIDRRPSPGSASAQRDRQHALRRLRPAAGVDDLQRAQPISRRDGGRAALLAGSRRPCATSGSRPRAPILRRAADQRPPALFSASARERRRRRRSPPIRRAIWRSIRSPPAAIPALRPALRCRPRARRWCRWRRSPVSRPARRRSPSITRARSSPRRSRSISRPATRSARRRQAIAEATADIRMPSTVRGAFAGTAATYQQSLAGAAAADRRGAAGGLYRARRALRELHPPADDHLDAALGQRRRAARAQDVQHRIHDHRVDRHHSADRHRQEERDHDDRLRAAGRARGAVGRARRSPRPACCASARS